MHYVPLYCVHARALTVHTLAHAPFVKEDVDAVYEAFQEVRAQNLNRSGLALPHARRTLALPIGVDFHSMDHPRGAAKLPGGLEQVHVQ
jgi:hypothetical protein